jgi:hypothetical protein
MLCKALAVDGERVEGRWARDGGGEGEEVKGPQAGVAGCGLGC